MNRSQVKKATSFTPSLSRADVKYRQRNANKQVRQATKVEIGYALSVEPFEEDGPLPDPGCDHYVVYDDMHDHVFAYCSLCGEDL